MSDEMTPEEAREFVRQKAEEARRLAQEQRLQLKQPTREEIEERLGKSKKEK